MGSQVEMWGKACLIQMIWCGLCQEMCQGNERDGSEGVKVRWRYVVKGLVYILKCPDVVF